MLGSVDADRSASGPERVGTFSNYSATCPISTQPANRDSGLLRPQTMAGGWPAEAAGPRGRRHVRYAVGKTGNARSEGLVIEIFRWHYSIL
jgi:hypothetical protein